MKTVMGILLCFGATVLVCALVMYGYGDIKEDKQVLVTVCQPTQQEQVILPSTVKDTDLIVQSLACYEGPYLEDGTYEEVCNVAALVVVNGSEHMLKQVELHIQTKERILCFTGSWIPSGSSCLLLESKRQAYANEPILHCGATQYQTATAQTNHICVKNTSDTEISIKNTGNRPANKVMVRYKTYLPQTDTYIGGVTNEYLVQLLQPGEERTGLLPRYVAEYSKIVIVEINE